MIELVSKHTRDVAKIREIPADNIHVGVDEMLLLEKPSSAELDALAQKFDLERGNLDDALDKDELPRLDHDMHHGYLYVRFPFTHRDGSPTTRPLLAIYNETDLIIIFPERPESLVQLFSEQSDFSTRSSQTALLKLLANIFNNYDVYIKKMGLTIKAIIDKMRKRNLASEDFVSFVLIEDQVNSFRSALTPMVPLLHRLAASRHLRLTSSESDLLEDVTLAVEQSIHLCDTNASRIVSIREAYATLSNNSLNRTMKTLTLATLLVAAPNLIFGMYGMNVHLPFQWENWGYYFALSLAVLLILLVILWARRRRLL